MFLCLCEFVFFFFFFFPECSFLTTILFPTLRTQLVCPEISHAVAFFQVKMWLRCLKFSFSHYLENISFIKNTKENLSSLYSKQNPRKRIKWEIFCWHLICLFNPLWVHTFHNILFPHHTNQNNQSTVQWKRSYWGQLSPWKLWNVVLREGKVSRSGNKWLVIVSS